MTKKEQFLQRFNEAFANNDIEFILQNVTSDIEWNIKGEKLIVGTESFLKSLREMQSDTPLALTVENIFSHGNTAAVNGQMRATDGRIWAFCDIYTLSVFKNPKVKTITSYVVELTKKPTIVVGE